MNRKVTQPLERYRVSKIIVLMLAMACVLTLGIYASAALSSSAPGFALALLPLSILLSITLASLVLAKR